MTETAQKIMELFKHDDKAKPGMVLPLAQLHSQASDWGPHHYAKLEEAMRELRSEGYVVITPSKNLELTEEGYDFLDSN